MVLPGKKKLWFCQENNACFHPLNDAFHFDNNKLNGLNILLLVVMFDVTMKKCFYGYSHS